MKKFIKISAVVLASVAVLVGLFFVLGQNMVNNIQSAYEGIRPLDLAEKPDGVYTGSAGEFITSVRLNVIVRDHRIEDIVIDNQICSSTHKALDTVDRIKEKQSAGVDATAGATWSSRSIMAATFQALEEKGN